MTAVEVERHNLIVTPLALYCPEKLPVVRILLKINWRRGGDSNTIRDNPACNLQIVRCQGGHRCHGCQGSLEADNTITMSRRTAILRSSGTKTSAIYGGRRTGTRRNSFGSTPGPGPSISSRLQTTMGTSIAGTRSTSRGIA